MKIRVIETGHCETFEFAPDAKLGPWLESLIKNEAMVLNFGRTPSGNPVVTLQFHDKEHLEKFRGGKPNQDMRATKYELTIEKDAVCLIGTVQIDRAKGINGRNIEKLRTKGNFFAQEVAAKRLGLLREFVPKAARIAVLVNPGSPSTAEPTLKGVRQAARRLGLEISILNASTVAEIDAAFTALARERTDALFVAGDGFFNSRRVPLATLAARDRVPMSFASREYVDVGGLMNYGANIAEMFRQVGLYAGQILKGAKLPSYRCCSRPNSSSSSTCKRLGHSALRCPTRSNCSPTRSSSEAPRVHIAARRRGGCVAARGARSRRRRVLVATLSSIIAGQSKYGVNDGISRVCNEPPDNVDIDSCLRTQRR
jgi:hypothetical protein